MSKYIFHIFLVEVEKGWQLSTRGEKSKSTSEYVPGLGRVKLACISVHPGLLLWPKTPVSRRRTRGVVLFHTGACGEFFDASEEGEVEGLHAEGNDRWLFGMSGGSKESYVLKRLAGCSL